MVCTGMLLVIGFEEAVPEDIQQHTFNSMFFEFAVGLLQHIQLYLLS